MLAWAFLQMRSHVNQGSQERKHVTNIRRYSSRLSSLRDRLSWDACRWASAPQSRSGRTTKGYTNATRLAPHLRPSGRSLGPLDNSELSSLVYPHLSTPALGASAHYSASSSNERWTPRCSQVLVSV